MDNKSPIHITNEKDLEFYEKFISDIKREHGKTMPNNNTAPAKKSVAQTHAKSNISPTCPDMLYDFLSSHIGKLLRVDFLIGDRLESRKGKLLNVGKEYIVLKLFQNGCTVICDINSIKFVTVVHDNDISKLRKI